MSEGFGVARVWDNRGMDRNGQLSEVKRSRFLLGRPVTDQRTRALWAHSRSDRDEQRAVYEWLRSKFGD